MFFYLIICPHEDVCLVLSQSQILLVPFSSITHTPPLDDATFMRFEASNRSALELTVIGITAAAAAIPALRT
jgi:hypothetical protein